MTAYVLLWLQAHGVRVRLSWWQWAVGVLLAFVALGELGQAVGYD